MPAWPLYLILAIVVAFGVPMVWLAGKRGGLPTMVRPWQADNPLPSAAPASQMRKLRLRKRHGYWLVETDPRDLPAADFYRAIDDMEAAYRWAGVRNDMARYFRESERRAEAEAELREVTLTPHVPR